MYVTLFVVRESIQDKCTQDGSEPEGNMPEPRQMGLPQENWSEYAAQ